MRRRLAPGRCHRSADHPRPPVARARPAVTRLRLAALLAFVYVGRLVILNPKSPGLLIAAVPSGLLVNPVWLVWLELVLWRTRRLDPLALGR